MMKYKSLIAIIGVVVVILALFFIPRFTNPGRASIQAWKKIDVDCLSSHQNANLHIHPELRIFVDGVPEALPAGIGIVQGCMSEMHTHSVNDTLHVESISAGKEFTLGQFFSVWEKTIERPGYTMEMIVDGLPSTEFDDLILRDKQVIILNYAGNATE